MEFSRSSKQKIISEIEMILHLDGEEIPEEDRFSRTEAVLSWIGGSYNVVRTCEFHTHSLHLYSYFITPNYYGQAIINPEVAHRIRACDQHGNIVFDSGHNVSSVDIAVRRGNWRRKLRSAYVNALYEDPV